MSRGFSGALCHNFTCGIRYIPLEKDKRQISVFGHENRPPAKFHLQRDLKKGRINLPLQALCLWWVLDSVTGMPPNFDRCAVLLFFLIQKKVNPPPDCFGSCDIIPFTIFQKPFMERFVKSYFNINFFGVFRLWSSCSRRHGFTSLSVFR